MEQTQYDKGYIKALQKVIDIINDDVVTLLTKNPEPNTPSQIHNGGRLKALYKLRDKCLDLKEKKTK